MQTLDNHRLCSGSSASAAMGTGGHVNASLHIAHTHFTATQEVQGC